MKAAGRNPGSVVARMESGKKHRIGFSDAHPGFHPGYKTSDQ
jgi:hypothetical protein